MDENEGNNTSPPGEIQIEIPRLALKKMLEESSEPREAHSQEDDSKDKDVELKDEEYYQKHFSDIKQVFLTDTDKNLSFLTKFIIFIQCLFDQAPPSPWIELFSLVVMCLSILSMILSPLLQHTFGYISHESVLIYSYIFLWGSASSIVFHFGFFFGTFLVTFLVLLVVVCFYYPKSELGFLALGYSLQVSKAFYIPSMIGLLSVIFRLISEYTGTVQDAYIFVFGIVGIIEAFVLFFVLFSSSLIYYEWRPPTSLHKNFMGRSHARFDLFLLVTATLLCVAYHFTLLLDYVVVSLNLFFTILLTYVGIYYVPFYSNIINYILVFFLYLLQLSSILVLFSSIFIIYF